jgi:hypothetical protein
VQYVIAPDAVTATTDVYVPDVLVPVQAPAPAASTVELYLPLVHGPLFAPAPVDATTTLYTPTVTTADPVTIMGTNIAAATSSTIPTHAVGDDIHVFAFTNAAATAPTKPSAGGTVPAWATIDSGTGGSGFSAIHHANFVATATNHTSGVWTGATLILVVVIRGQKSSGSPIGGHAILGSFTTAVTAPSVTMSVTDGSSLLMHVHCYNSADAQSFNAAPAGYTRQATSNGVQGICLNTKNVTTTDGTCNQTITGFGAYYTAVTVEILK